MQLNSIRSKIIYDQEGVLRLMVPICGGGTIGLDNTCQTVIELQQFFGYKNSDSALNALSKLSVDLNLYSALTGQELSFQIRQLSNYYKIIKRISELKDFKESLVKKFGIYPQAIGQLLNSSKNIFAIRLSVEKEHSFFAMPQGSIVFSGGKYLGMGLRHGLVDLPQAKSPREQFLDIMKHSVYEGEGALKAYATRMGLVIKDMFDQDVQFDTDESKLRDIYGGELSHEEYVEGLMGLNAPDLFNLLPISPFYGEKLSHAASMEDNYAILTQLFVAEMNLYCVTHSISEKDFGCVLETEIFCNLEYLLRESVIDVVRAAFYENASVEEALVQWLNSNHQAFAMKRPLLGDETQQIIQRFRLKVSQIHDAEYFDEFVVCDTEAEFPERDRAYNYQNKICFDLMDIAKQVKLDNMPEYIDQLQLIDLNELVTPLLPTCLVSNEVKTNLNINPDRYDAKFMSSLLGSDASYDNVSDMLLYNTDKGPLCLALKGHNYKAEGVTPEWGQVVFATIAKSAHREDFQAIRQSAIARDISDEVVNFIQYYTQGGTRPNVSRVLPELSAEEMLAINLVFPQGEAILKDILKERVRILSNYLAGHQSRCQELERLIWSCLVVSYAYPNTNEQLLSSGFINKVRGWELQATVGAIGKALKDSGAPPEVALKLRQRHPELAEVVDSVFTRHLDWFVSKGGRRIESYLYSLSDDVFDVIFSGQAANSAINIIVAKLQGRLFNKVGLKKPGLIKAVNLDHNINRFLYLALRAEKPVLMSVVKHMGMQKIQESLSQKVNGATNLSYCLSTASSAISLLQAIVEAWPDEIDAFLENNLELVDVLAHNLSKVAHGRTHLYLAIQRCIWKRFLREWRREHQDNNTPLHKSLSSMVNNEQARWILATKELFMITVDELSSEELDGYLKEGALPILEFLFEEETLHSAAYECLLFKLSDNALINALDTKVKNRKFIDWIKKNDRCYQSLVMRLPEYAYQKGYSYEYCKILLQRGDDSVYELMDSVKVSLCWKEALSRFMKSMASFCMGYFIGFVIVSVIESSRFNIAIAQSLMSVFSGVFLPLLFVLCISGVIFTLFHSLTFAALRSKAIDANRVFEKLLERGQITLLERFALLFSGNFSMALRLSPSLSKIPTTVVPSGLADVYAASPVRDVNVDRQDVLRDAPVAVF